MGKIHVVPGRIEYNERPYHILVDCFESADRDECGDDSDEEKAPWEKLQDHFTLDHVKLVIRESFLTLEVWYDIQDSAGRAVGTSLNPGELVVKGSLLRGLMTCNSSHVNTDHDVEAVYQQLPDRLNRADVRLKLLNSTVLGRCAALILDSRYGALILRDKECLNCCVKTALKKDPNWIIIISKLTRT